MKLDEKAVSRSQQRFFGMVRAAQKTGEVASPEVARVAADISKKGAKDFASTKHKGLPEKKKIEEEKSFDEFRLTLKTHTELNPKIWTDKKLDPEIATNLIKIGKEWAKFADIPEKFIKDYIIVGGNANFNYTKYSDIDLHLVVDKSKIGCDGCLDDFLRAKKQLWALTHNITIKGHPVELYAQDIDEIVGSKGQYSLNQKKWTQEPTPYKMNRKDPEVVKKVKDFIYQIDSLINAKSDDKVVFQNLKDKIGTMRKAAIQKAGEYAPENLVFKELRNRGYVEKVWNYLRDLGDKELSVEETQIDEAERRWAKGYDSGDKTVPRRKALDRAEYFDNRGENERANKIRRIAISKDHGETHEARKKAKNIKISDKVGKLRPASIDDKRGAVSGDVQKKLKEELEETTWSAMILLPSNKRRKVTFTAPSMSRKDALQIVKALYGATDVTQLNRLKYKRFKRVNEDIIDEIYGSTFDTPKERQKSADAEKERKEKNLRMKYGKNWKTIVQTKREKKPLRRGEVKKLVRGKWVSNKD